MPARPLYYAHSAEDELGNLLPYEHWQTLQSHSVNVGEMAAEFARVFDAQEIACQTGQLLWGSDNICIREKKKIWRKKLAGAPVCGALAFLGGEFMQKWKMVGIGGKWSKIGFYFA